MNPQEQHDALMALKPSEAQHDPTSCPFCAQANDPGGPMSDYTKEDVDRMIAEAVAAATSPLQTRIGELEAASQETEVGKAVAEATEPLQTTIADLQQKLDEAVAAQTAATEALESERAAREAEKAAEAEATALAAKRVERLAAAKDVKAPWHTDEYLEANADEFAAMSDEAWAAKLDEWKLIIEATTKPGTPAPPKPTAMQASRFDTGSEGSALSLVGDMYLTRGAAQKEA